MNSAPDPSGGILAGFVVLYGVFLVLIVASLVFWVVEIVDVARRQWADPNSKTVWLLVVILGHSLGAIVYYFAGKPSGWLPGETPRYANYPPTYPPNTPPPPGQWPPPPGPQ